MWITIGAHARNPARPSVNRSAVAVWGLLHSGSSHATEAATRSGPTRLRGRELQNRRPAAASAIAAPSSIAASGNADPANEPTEWARALASVAIAQAGQARAGIDIGTADAVVRDGDLDAIVAPDRRDCGVRGLGVLPDVRE